ncbi:hypothetical protein B9Z55_024140 [Caenorhabditis nigoni]|uniref:Uncharacterized protein n=1 Tax=Caenorhabditis nigoni TaxID=1611254 RepID=A0A2G5ST48_9PELO|nr:hypothetical protein B9Z55_024140 [Caenorhabditis nigoni]
MTNAMENNVTDEAKKAIRTLHSVALNGAFFTEQHVDKLCELSAMDLPDELREDLKDLLERQNLLEKIAGAVVTMMTQRLMGSMPDGFPGFIAPGFMPPEAPPQPGLQKPGPQQLSAQQQVLNQNMLDVTAPKEAEKKADPEAVKKRKPETVGQRREREERARKAKEETAVRDRVKRENQKKARLEDAARQIEAFRDHTMRGNLFSQDEKLKFWKISLMPDLPPHQKEEIKQIWKQQEQVEGGFMPTGAQQQPVLQPSEPQQPSVRQFLNQVQGERVPRPVLHQQAQQQALMAPGFHQQQLQMQQIMDQAGPHRLPQGTLASAQTPRRQAIAVPKPRLSIEAAQPNPAEPERVVLELWPTNGYSMKKNYHDPMFISVKATANLGCVVRLVGNRLRCRDVCTLWGFKLENRCVRMFNLDEKVAVVQQFVGQQRVIMFYDDESAAHIRQPYAYLVPLNFRHHTGQRNN